MDLQIKTRALSSLLRDVKKGKFNFSHPLQRKENQWNKLQKSELIDSIFRSYPIIPLLVDKSEGMDIFSVIEGKQRLTTLRDFVEEVFPLSNALEPVVIDGVTYEIAGKKFTKLDEPLKEKFNSFEIQLYIISDATETDIKEIFRRTNSGKPLSNTQKRTVIESEELRDIVYSLISHPLFKKIITKVQSKKDEDKDFVREVLMLTEMDNYELVSFRSNDIDKFIEYYNENINQKEIELVTKSLDALNENFEEMKIKKTSIPMVIYGMYKTIKEGKSTEKYVHWLKSFLENYDSSEEYTQYCGTGTANANMVKGRVDYFNAAVDGL